MGISLDHLGHLVDRVVVSSILEESEHQRSHSVVLWCHFGDDPSKRTGGPDRNRAADEFHFQTRTALLSTISTSLHPRQSSIYHRKCSIVCHCTRTPKRKNSSTTTVLGKSQIRVHEKACNLEQFPGDIKTIATTASLDGPYGGLPHAAFEHRYDSVLLIAGGSGITVCLSWLLHFLILSRPTRLSTVTLVWSFRNLQSLQWVADELSFVATATKPAKENGLEIRMMFYVTGTAEEDEISSDSVALNEEADTIRRIQELGQTHPGRPNLRTVISKFATVQSTRTAVVASGTHEMNFDIANICATMQMDVVAGRLSELALHVESFRS